MSTMLLALAACVKEEPVSVSFNSDTYQMTVGDTLNLAGELVDVDGTCGGYNLQWAWSSGYVAGLHAATDEVLL